MRRLTEQNITQMRDTVVRWNVLILLECSPWKFRSVLRRIGVPLAIKFYRTLQFYCTGLFYIARDKMAHIFVRYNFIDIFVGPQF